MRETLPQKPFDFPISPSNSSTSSLVWCQILGVAVFSLFQPRVVHFDVPISRDRSASRSGPVSEGGKNHRLGRRMEGPSASNACRLQSLLSPALNNPPIHVNSRPGPTPFEVFIRLASLLEVMTGVPKNHHRTWKVLVVTAPRSSGGLWTLLTMYIYVGAVAPPGASQRRLSTLQPKGSARHGVRPCAHHNSHSSKSIYDPSFQWPSWPKRRASFEPGYVTPNLEIPGLYWTAFKYARMSSIFEDLTPLLVTHVK